MTATAKASTHRLDPAVQAALDHLSDVLQRPKNRLINEAVTFYIQQKSRELEHELESTLRALRSYRLKDPDFEDAIDTIVDAEAQMGGSDPAEGCLIQETPPEAERGKVRAKIRRRLHAT